MKRCSFEELYKTGRYLELNPTVHEEDATWKFDKIKPFLDRYCNINEKRELKLLDIGGGMGSVSLYCQNYMYKKYGKKIIKIAIDLSLEMLKLQKQKKSEKDSFINANAKNLPIKNKSIDLTFLIDVLEHIVSPEYALKEIARVSDYVIIKVPLEDNLYIKLKDFLTKGATKKERIEKVGHINAFNFEKIRSYIESYCGEIVSFAFTNQFEYLISRDKKQSYLGRVERFIKYLALHTYKLSPYLCSKLFNDFGIIFIKCY